MSQVKAAAPAVLKNMEFTHTRCIAAVPELSAADMAEESARVTQFATGTVSEEFPKEGMTVTEVIATGIPMEVVQEYTLLNKYLGLATFFPDGTSGSCFLRHSVKLGHDKLEVRVFALASTIGVDENSLVALAQADASASWLLATVRTGGKMLVLNFHDSSLRGECKVFCAKNLCL